MDTKLETKRKKSTAQEAFQHLREQTKIELEEKKQKVKDAHDKFVADRTRKKLKEEAADTPKKEESKHMKEPQSHPAKENKKVEIHEASEHHIPHGETSHGKFPISKPEHTGGHQINLEWVKTRQHNRKRKGRCTNCCGGLPGQGPAKPRNGCGSQSCCNSAANRLRGGSDDRRDTRRDLPKIFECRSSSVPPNEFEFQMSSLRSRDFSCSSCESAELEEDSTSDNFPMYDVERSRGGCGGCRGPPQPCYRTPYQRDCAKLINPCSPPPCSPSPCSPPPCSPPPCSPPPCSPPPCSPPPCSPPPCSPPPCSRSPCCQPCPPPLPACQRPPVLCAKTSSTNTKGCCPCGGCGGPACSDNPSGGRNGPPTGGGGCCGGSRLQGLPCKCKCQSCSTCPPAGGCGGQSCGRIYSCAGSSGGRCCFPRNSKRRSGADCCGGSDPNCGGCC